MCIFVFIFYPIEGIDNFKVGLFELNLARGVHTKISCVGAILAEHPVARIRGGRWMGDETNLIHPKYTMENWTFCGNKIF